MMSQIRLILLAVLLVNGLCWSDDLRGAANSPTDLNSVADDKEAVTIYVVRHADRDGKLDRLTETGKQRAEKLKDLMTVFGPAAVFSTDFQRTLQTAQPTAAALKLTVQKYRRSTPDWIDQIKTQYHGKSVLIVGHSNTIVPIANGFGARFELTIPEDVYDNLLVITVSKDETRAVRVRFWKQP